jgi:hypothetical protein
VTRALIGYTGFVGSNLDGDSYTHRYNSKNFRDMIGMEFDEVVCAGVSAVKWWANANPIEDWKNIWELAEVLRTITVRNRFILISTIDVYPDPSPEWNDLVVPEHDPNHCPYGRHRLWMEKFVARCFGSKSKSVRLPGLFGPGLKKNLIYDLLTTGKSNANGLSRFQWYPIRRLKSVIDDDPSLGDYRIGSALNLFPEPLYVYQILPLFPTFELEKPGSPIVDYDVRTLFGNHQGYTMSSEEVLGELKQFIVSFQPRLSEERD